MDGNGNNGFVGDDNPQNPEDGGNQPQLFDIGDGRKLTADELIANRKELEASYTRERMKAAEYEKRYGGLDNPAAPNQPQTPAEGLDPETEQELEKMGFVSSKKLKQIQSENDNKLMAVVLKTSAERFADQINANAKIPELKVDPQALAQTVAQKGFMDQNGNWDFQGAYDYMTYKVQLQHKEEIDKAFEKGRGVPASGATDANTVTTPLDIKDDDSFGDSIDKALDSIGWGR